MTKKLVVVLDTNVLVSGLLTPNGIPGTILGKFRNGEFLISTSSDQILEIKSVLKRPSLKKALPLGTPRDAVKFFAKLRTLTKVHRPPSLDWEVKDQGDHFLLDLVAFAKPDFFVTGDKELLRLRLIGATAVVSPIEFIGRL